MSKDPQIEEELSEAEIAKRRDEVIRRMLNKPPEPKPAKRATTKKKPIDPSSRLG